MADRYLERLLNNPDIHEFGRTEEEKEQGMRDEMYWLGEGVVHDDGKRGIGGGDTYIDEVLLHLTEAEKSWKKPFVKDVDFILGLVDAVRMHREEMGKDA
jgi:hypothetical protein